MSLQKNVKELDFDGQRVVLKRPGRGGISRIAVRISHRIQGDPTIAQLDGAGVEMEAILHEYLAEGPAEWRLKDSKGKLLGTARPVAGAGDAPVPGPGAA